jgi:hypothetical protein
MVDGLAQHALEVAAAEGDQPVQALSAGTPHLALGITVRNRRLHRRTNDPHPVGREDVLDRERQLLVVVADQEPGLWGTQTRPCGRSDGRCCVDDRSLDWTSPLVDEHLRTCKDSVPSLKSSCGRQGLARILAQQSAQSLAARDPSDGHNRIGASNRVSEVKPTMGSGFVVMLEPLRENKLCMPPTDDQKPI